MKLFASSTAVSILVLASGAKAQFANTLQVTSPPVLNPSKEQKRATDQVNAQFNMLCALEPQTARPTVCDQKNKYLAAAKNEIEADEKAGNRLASMLADAGSLADCYIKKPSAQDACEAKKKNGVPDQVREAAQEIIPEKLGGSSPSANDKDVAEIARSLMKWIDTLAGKASGASKAGRSHAAD